MITLGDMRLHLLLDCTAQVDAGGPFGLVPRSLWKSFYPYDEDNRVTNMYQALLVQTGGQNILVDTGYGTKLPDKQKKIMVYQQPRGTLLEGLARLSLAPTDIHLVIDTHLHGDHAGGNTTLDEDGTLQSTFPNAEYVVQRREYDDAMHPNERTRATYLLENYQPLVEGGQMRLLDGDTELAPGVWGVITPGHTPAHMSVRLESNGEHALYTCDMASFAVHFERLGWMTAYDVEPLVTLETKRRWQGWALETDALLLFPHDAYRPVGRYVMGEDGKGVVKAVDEVYV